MILLLQQPNQTSQAYQLCICTLHCLLGSSVSVIDLFVELQGLDLLDQIPNMTQNEEIRQLAEELAAEIRPLITSQ